MYLKEESHREGKLVHKKKRNTDRKILRNMIESRFSSSLLSHLISPSLSPLHLPPSPLLPAQWWRMWPWPGGSVRAAPVTPSWGTWWWAGPLSCLPLPPAAWVVLSPTASLATWRLEYLLLKYSRNAPEWMNVCAQTISYSEVINYVYSSLTVFRYLYLFRIIYLAFR